MDWNFDTLTILAGWHKTAPFSVLFFAGEYDGIYGGISISDNTTVNTTLSRGIENEQDSPIYYQTDRSGAVSQAINGCAVHNSGQMCLFQGKNGRDFRVFTKSRTTILSTTAVGGRERKIPDR